MLLTLLRFSGVSEDDVKSSSSSLRDVQAALLSFICADTILVGHGLENDLCALKVSRVFVFSSTFPAVSHSGFSVFLPRPCYILLHNMHHVT